jgi:hypothetical protein
MVRRGTSAPISGGPGAHRIGTVCLTRHVPWPMIRATSEDGVATVRLLCNAPTRGRE